MINLNPMPLWLIPLMYAAGSAICVRLLGKAQGREVCPDDRVARR
jgi:hypothetical protein